MNGRTGLRLSRIRFSTFQHLRGRVDAKRDLDRRRMDKWLPDRGSLRHIPSLPVHELGRIESEGDRPSSRAMSGFGQPVRVLGVGDVLHVKSK